MRKLKQIYVQVYTRFAQKRSQATATCCELGRYPLGIDIVTNIIQCTEYLKKE